MPFSRNLRFSHTMATDSSDQLNFNPTTTTEENPKQTLDNDTTLTSVSSLQLHVNTGPNSGFNSPLSDSLCSVSYVSFQTNKRRKKENQKGSAKKKNRENLKNFVHSLQQQTIQMLSHSFSATTDNSEGRLWFWELIALKLWSSSSESVRWLY